MTSPRDTSEGIRFVSICTLLPIQDHRDPKHGDVLAVTSANFQRVPFFFLFTLEARRFLVSF